MTQPKDRAFATAVREQLEGTGANERIVFFDTDNKVREAVYPAEFETGVLMAVRERLEKEGVLKAVVHISAYIFGSPKGHGPRTTVVEYLPTHEWYGYTFRPAVTRVADEDAFEIALESTRTLFGEGEEEEE